MGRSDAARYAGYRPANTPTRRATPKARGIEYVANTGCTPSILNRTTTKTAKMPRMPPSIEMTTASIRNWLRTTDLGAPMALRMPISRVRSVTVTSMMFMTPIAPTSSETAATQPSRAVNVFELDVAVDRRLAWLSTENGRFATVVLFWAARMLSTSLWARVSVADDFPCTSNWENDCDWPVN